MSKTITSTTEQSVPEISTTTSEPKYKGVRKRKWGKWVSEIRLPNSRERIWLGSYDSPEKAARAFDAALFCLRGPGAKFNFPENPPSNNITGPGGGARSGSLSAQEIQAFAARYATEEPTRLTSPDYLQISSAETSTSRSSPSHLMEHYTTTSSSDGIVPVDWSLLNMLDPNEGAAASEFGMFSGLDISMNMTTDELYPPPPAAATPISMIDDNEEDQNVFSHSSFLWNF